MKDNITVTFACFNAVDYTKSCIESLVNDGLDLKQLVIVDNASSDSTLEELEKFTGLSLIRNKLNLGCGVAWNQGALFRQTEWTLVMNNDVQVCPGWIDGLISAAKKYNLQVACPAMVEGSDDYDIAATGSLRSKIASEYVRMGHVHAVAMMIHSSVWSKVGYFRAAPKLLGYEDTIFFNECYRANIRMGTVGSSWIHHYGSVTQNIIRVEKGLAEHDKIGDRHNYLLLGKSRLTRKLEKFWRRRSLKSYQRSEIFELGFSLQGRKVLREEVNWKVY